MSMREICEQIAETGTLGIKFFKQHSKVQVPNVLRNDPQWDLTCTLNFTSDSNISNEGIRQTISFDGEEYECFVPYTAMVGLSSRALPQQPRFIPDDEMDDEARRICDSVFEQNLKKATEMVNLEKDEPLTRESLLDMKEKISAWKNNG